MLFHPQKEMDIPPEGMPTRDGLTIVIDCIGKSILFAHSNYIRMRQLC